MKGKLIKPSSIILLSISALLIWMGYHIMKVERWEDKYLFLIGLIAALMGIAIIGYLFIWARE